MRKIEREMIAAIKAGKNRKDGNTEVCHWAAGGMEDGCRVYLFGHRIAERQHGKWVFSLAGWNTPTTRSRLQSLLQEFGGDRRGIYTKMGQAYVRRYASQVRDPQGADQPIDSKEWF